MLRTISRLCAVACWCLLAAQGALAEEAPKMQAPDLNQCTYLKIHLEGRRPAAVTSSGIGCDRGYLTSILPSQTDTTEVTLQQSPAYGPDCLITITAGGGGTYVIRTQQNYCGLAAGRITAVVVGGAARIRAQEGSFIRSRPGQVWVTLN
jgi:hypothetical protein